MIDKKLMLLVFLTEPRRFSEIVSGIGLSPSTASKYIKYFSALGLIRRDGDKYVITLDGIEFIKDRVTLFVQKMINSGLVREIRVSTSPDKVSFSVEDGSVVLRIDARGVDVIIDLGDNIDDAISVFAGVPLVLLGGEE